MILILLVIYLLIYIVLVRFVTRLLVYIPQTTRNKRIVLGICVFIAVGLPVWDVPWVHLHFNYLCKTQAGIHIYEEVLLGPEYWNENGSLNESENTYYEKSIERFLPKKYELNGISEYNISEIAKTQRWRDQIIRVNDRKVVGEFIMIGKGMGWFNRFVGGRLLFPNGETTCPNLYDRSSISTDELVGVLFKPKVH